MSDRHVTLNRDYWNGAAEDWVAAGERLWSLETPVWGFWDTPEPDLRMLPENMNGLDAIELGCGTGYVSGWMTRRGARATGIDIADKQLATARRLAAEHGAEITFLEGNAEATGLPEASFDFAVSEYGAAIWCDPRIWVPEAHRLLRPGGRLVFLGNHPLVLVCSPDTGEPCTNALQRSYRRLAAVDWTDAEVDPGGMEFNLSFEAWLRLFRETGFAVNGYRELYAPDSFEGVRFAVPADWARSYPSEQVWWLEKAA